MKYPQCGYLLVLTFPVPLQLLHLTVFFLFIKPNNKPNHFQTSYIVILSNIDCCKIVLISELTSFFLNLLRDSLTAGEEIFNS